MEKVARRPRPIMRYYVAGEEVDGEAFWRAIRRLGGTATVVAHPPKRVGYRLTPAGAAALDAAEQEQEARHQAAKDQAREPGRWPTGTGRAGR